MLARHARDRLRHSRGTRLVNGNALVAKLAVNAFARGIPLWLSSPVVELVMENGRVSGAIVEREGQRVSVHARRGVVLACGGFPANQDLKRRVYGHLAAGKNHILLPPPGNTGDGLRLAQGVGGHFHDEVHQPAAWTPVSLVPQADGSTVPFPHFFDRGKPGYISVDRRGRRFVNEAKSYHVFVPAMIEACRDDSIVEAWVVCDHKAIRRFGLGALGPAPMRLKPFLGSGYVKRGENVAALRRPAASTLTVCSGLLLPSTARPVVARTPSCSAGRMPISASTALRATRPTHPLRLSTRRRSMPCASYQANSAPLLASPRTLAPG